MRNVAWSFVVLLSGCMPGCGGETTEAEPARAVPVRLPSSGAGDDEPTPVEAPSDDLADPPPVEPPPPVVAPSE